MDMHRITALITGLLVLLVSMSLLAKTPEDRISSLERQLSDLQKTYMRNNQGVASSIAGAQAIREEWGVLKGDVDTNRHLIQSQHQEMMRHVDELDHRIQAIEDRMQIFSRQLSQALGTVAPKEAAEGDLYQKGLDLVNQSKYLEAAAVFEKFVKKYRKSPFVASARAWIGECFYSMRDYQRAIKEYQQFVEKYPRDKNVSTAILKQGNSFYELGMMEEAKLFYQKILQSYPSSSAASQAKAKLEIIKTRELKAKEATSGLDSLSSYPTETLQQKQQRLRKESGSSPAPQAGKKKKSRPVREF